MTDSELLAHLEARDRCWRLAYAQLTDGLLDERAEHVAAAVEGLRDRGGVFRLGDGREFYLGGDGLDGIVRHDPHDGYPARQPSAVRLTEPARRQVAALNARRFGTTNGRA
jgi:hypothetical protein